MEYYIFDEGKMLDACLEILKQKAAEGVDVRVIYDAFGCLLTLPPEYEKELRKYGIKCYQFCPIELTIHISDYAMLNHRNHRKLTVIDGEVAFSGGLNIADEYINLKPRFGEWKDTAFKIYGEAVYSLLVNFLGIWDYVSGETSDFETFYAKPALPQNTNTAESFIQPYFDSPLDAENVSENAYLNIINSANDYVYISTPYLILDHEMTSSLTLAAKRGIDVRILTPGIPDKPKVFAVTRSYYPALLKAGVKIFEYTPGFNHAKMYVSDDNVAIIGSANMDYRSLYLHFENCVCFYGGKIVNDAKADMLLSFKKSREVSLEEVKNISVWNRLFQVVARFISPIL